MDRLRWADRATRQRIVRQVMAVMSAEELTQVRHVLDRDSLRRTLKYIRG